MDEYSERLYTPTQIIKLKSNYFIIDCWHHRILHSHSITTPISEWSVLDDQLSGPHSIATDGELYVSESTGSNSIVTYRQTDESKFKRIQTIQNVGIRPHKTVYDPVQCVFFVIGSGNQTLYIFRKFNGALEQVGSFLPPNLAGQYVRSITIHNNELYFVGNFNIIIYAIVGDTLKFRKNIKLTPKLTRANDIFFIGDNAGFITVKPGRMFYFADIEELGGESCGRVVDLSRLCIGTPYYMSVFDDAFWVPEIDGYSRICKYDIHDMTINFDKQNILFDFGKTTQSSINRKNSFKL
jgi:hypothetical protein